MPIHHGEKFLAAVKQTNKQVDWVEYDDEGHGWSLASTRIDFWGRVEKFLDLHIGPQRAEAGGQRGCPMKTDGRNSKECQNETKTP